MARSRELKVVIAGDADKLDRELRKSGASLDKFGKQTRLTGSLSSKGFAAMRVGAVGATAAVGGLVLTGKKVIDVASDIDESLSKNRVLFGKYAQDIDKFSKTSATSLGISRKSALEATGTFGNLFTALEIGPKASAQMSTSLVKLAADMASFNNASPEETLDAIRSGLVGETEPLRRFGVNLNDATLRTEALRMGLVKTTKESLEPQTKALAVNSLLFRQTAKAQGDFARTSKGAANQQKILNAQFSDAQAKLGGLLLPTFTKGITKVNRFVGEIQSGTGAGGKFADTLTDIWQDAKPIVTWIGRATANVAKFTAEHPNVGKLAAAVVGVGVAIKALKFASAATGFTNLLKLGRSTMRQLVKIFATQGAVAGSQAGLAAAGSEGMASSAVFNRTRGSGKRLGKVMGKGLIVGLIAGTALAIPDFVNWIQKTPLFSPKRLGEKIGKKIGNVLGAGAGDVAKGRYSDLAAAQTITGGATGGISGDIGGLSSTARGGLSQIQQLFGGVRVSSGHRTPEENRRVGGARNSDHLTGNALDLVPSGGWSAQGTALLDRVAGWARKNPAIRWIGWRGVPGHGPGDHLHLSFRPRGPQGLRGAGDVVDKLKAYGGKIRGKGDVVGDFRRAIRTTKAPPKAALALWMAGIVESGLRNLNYGDRDSLGPLQVREGIHGRMTPFQQAMSFLTRGFTGRGGAIALSGSLGSAGQVAQAVQGSAFPERYDQVRARALGYLGSATAAKSKGKGRSGGRSTRGRSSGGASENTRGRHGATMAPTGKTPEQVSAYEQALADADVGVAESEGRDNSAQLAAQKARGAVVGQRLQKVTAALKKKGLRPATRLRLTQERASLLGELRGIDSTMADLSKPAESGDDPNQALIEAMEANTAAQEAAREAAEQAAEAERQRTAELTALRGAIEQQNAIATAANTVQVRELWAFVASGVSGELGQRVGQRGTMPGSGQLASVGNSKY